MAFALAENVALRLNGLRPEGDRLQKEIMAVRVPQPILRRLEFFASQFEFCEAAGAQLEYKTKDTAKLSGVE